jgi:hypothetical protein
MALIKGVMAVKQSDRKFCFQLNFPFQDMRKKKTKKQLVYRKPTTNISRFFFFSGLLHDDHYHYLNIFSGF